MRKNDSVDGELVAMSRRRESSGTRKAGDSTILVRASLCFAILTCGGVCAADEYSDGRPQAALRLQARDQGVVLRHGDGPEQCDIYGARDVWVHEFEGTYYMHYDAAGPTAWLCSLAVSKDLQHWEKRGPILDLGAAYEEDSKSVSYGLPFCEGQEWHLFYLGTPNASPPPNRVPRFPYLTLKATGDSPQGPWLKQKNIVPFRPVPDTYYATTASPGHVVKHDGGYLQFFSASSPDAGMLKRTLGIARTSDIEGVWRVDESPIVPLDEQIENSSLYYEEANDTWFLFTNHIGIDGYEYTDAIWVYWSKDLNQWSPENKAVVLDGETCTWSKHIVGLPSVLKVEDRLAVFYDGLEGQTLPPASQSHMKRDIGLAWLDLPLVPPHDPDASPDTATSLRPMWIESDEDQGDSPGESRKDRTDTYVAFRGEFELTEPGEVEIRTLGVSWFNLWLDGEFVMEGPARFPKDRPEYDALRIRLSAGRHIIATQVHNIGLTTRILVDMPPFFACEILNDGKPLPMEWRCMRLPGYRPAVRRINPQLGWIEWCDTRQLPVGWRVADYDDTAWAKPVSQDPGIGSVTPLTINSVRSFTHKATPIAEGPLAGTFGYVMDDVPARFFLRDLECVRLPAQGLWRRYDLGRVRLARPRFALDLPAGTVVEFAYSEALSHGRVSPYITLSAGPSCNLDHYVARGGLQEFFPLTPKGGRFVEVHILADPAKVRFVREEFIERCYHDAPTGAFQSEDELLNRIWMTGIETYRGCAEDAVVDNPTRERGQWTGDVVTVGMDIAASGYGDVRLCRRALVQSALCARGDGLIAGLCPGGPSYMPTYAAQWVSACMHYWELTGDRAFLEEMFPYAQRNLAAFDSSLTADGLSDGLGWLFLDWGYQRNPGPSDMAYNLHYLSAVRDMVRWCRELEQSDGLPHYEAQERDVTRIVARWLGDLSAAGKWDQIGYHRAVLGLRLGFFTEQVERGCVDFIKSHILRCFPNDPSAPRSSDPGVGDPRLITPYFAHYAFPELIERGEMDFVLDQYRKCWGWALEEGRTTWVEVFDTRWTHCHQWAGCPTWQLSRYVLGLYPRYDLGERHYALSLETGSLQRCEGSLPLNGSDETIRVRWVKRDGAVHYDLVTPQPIHLHVGEADTGQGQRILRIDGEYHQVFSDS